MAYVKIPSVKQMIKGPSKCSTCTAIECKIQEKLGEQWACAYWVPDVVAAGIWPTDGKNPKNVSDRKGGNDLE
jgi:hypothetical protein